MRGVKKRRKKRRETSSLLLWFGAADRKSVCGARSHHQRMPGPLGFYRGSSARPAGLRRRLALTRRAREPSTVRIINGWEIPKLHAGTLAGRAAFALAKKAAAVPAVDPASGSVTCPLAAGVQLAAIFTVPARIMRPEIRLLRRRARFLRHALRPRNRPRILALALRIQFPAGFAVTLACALVAAPAAFRERLAAVRAIPFRGCAVVAGTQQKPVPAHRTVQLPYLWNSSPGTPRWVSRSTRSTPPAATARAPAWKPNSPVPAPARTAARTSCPRPRWKKARCFPALAPAVCSPPRWTKAAPRPPGGIR